MFGWRAARRGLVGMIVSWQEGKRRVGCEPIDQPVRLATSREQVRAIDEWRRKEPDGFVTVTGVGSRGGMSRSGLMPLRQRRTIAQLPRL